MIEDRFIKSPEYQDYLDNKDQISDESLVFVEDKERLITQGKEYQFVPSNIDLEEIQDKISGLENSGDEVYYVEAQEDGTLITSKEKCEEIFNRTKANDDVLVYLKVINGDSIKCITSVIKSYNVISTGGYASFLTYDCGLGGTSYYRLCLCPTTHPTYKGSYLEKYDMPWERTFNVGKGLSMDYISGRRTLLCTLDTTVFKVVDSLPSTPASGDENKVHLVKDDEGEEGNLFKEYLFVEGKWELIGQQKLEIDTSNFVDLDSMQTINGIKFFNNQLGAKYFITSYGIKIGGYDDGKGTGASLSLHNLKEGQTWQTMNMFWTESDKLVLDVATNASSTPYNTRYTFGENTIKVGNNTVLTNNNWGLYVQTASNLIAGLMSTSDKSKLDSIPSTWTGTQSEYDALGNYDNNTIYYIIEEE